MNLGDLAVGEKAKVAGYIKGSKTYRGKLMAMGLTKGTDFVITRVAPMGDPVEINVRGFALTLRSVGDVGSIGAAAEEQEVSVGTFLHISFLFCSTSPVRLLLLPYTGRPTLRGQSLPVYGLPAWPTWHLQYSTNWPLLVSILPHP